ncbi:cob(I)yrinic acid a,c-diamide adenosyltransferase [Candidatus Saccharibacteria bacterium]|jgi:cob(I)alamin adenosyltransferase|nr:cob(I)yrinic acid a,c-diamide adenosyltransferase [Candidatus Saccharibacteria bacterium]
MFEDYKSKESVKIVYTGEGKGKTSAAIGLVARALGTGWNVAFVQFIKHWDVGEHSFFDAITDVYKDNFTFHKGGKGFYDAGQMSAAGISEKQHAQAARETYNFAKKTARSGDYDLVVCDEINNAVHDGLLEKTDLVELIESASEKTSLCLTGRDFPEELLKHIDIATNMTKLKHHFDDKYLANKGIDY